MKESPDPTLIPVVGYMRLPAILKVIPVSASSWWKGIRKGVYPRGVKLGPNTTAWRAADIRALLQRLENQNNDLRAA